MWSVFDKRSIEKLLKRKPGVVLKPTVERTAIYLNVTTKFLMESKPEISPNTRAIVLSA